MIRQQIQSFRQQLPHLKRALQLVWTAAPRWTVGWTVLLVLQGLVPYGSISLTRLLVDNLVEVLSANQLMSSVVWLAAGLGGVLLLGQVLGALQTWVQAGQSAIIRDYLDQLILQQSISMDVSVFDSPDYFDRLHRAQTHGSQYPLTLLENLGMLLRSGLTLLSLLILLIPYGWWLPVVLFLSTLPALYVVTYHGQQVYAWQRRTTADTRRSWYYHWLMNTRENASEVRLFGLGHYFLTAFGELRQRLRSERLALLRKQGVAEVLAGIVALAIAGGAVVSMLWRVTQGLASLGDLTLFYQAFSQGQQVMGTLLRGVGQVYQQGLYLGDLFEYLSLAPAIVDPASPQKLPNTVEQGIRFREVTFSYPAGTTPALSNCDLFIPAGQTVAVVGFNGAGKSTLIKLLCRFYDPDSGAIEIDGIDVRSVRVAELHQRLTVLFQTPVRYHDSVLLNVQYGNVGVPAGNDDIETALNAAGATPIVDKLTHGHDSMLGTWFEGGTDLSVGEWQRLALARAFWRKAPILVLDEPTSAMDPWAEAEWGKCWQTLSENYTTLIITHRFTTARYADLIYVMDSGRVVESGTHTELIKANGLYAKSWREQQSS